MFSTTAPKSAPADIAPSTLSLEFAWQAKSTYWAGEIRVVDLYIDNQRRYSISIPQTDDRATQVVSLPFSNTNTRPGQSRNEINYLIIKNLDTTRKITLKAGIFNKKQGNILTRNFDGSVSRDIRYTREDTDITLDLSSLELGHHYKIIATHSSEREQPGSPFWQGSGLHTIIEAHGPSRQNSAGKVPTRATPFFTPSPTAAQHDNGRLLPSQLEFQSRMNRSNHPDEIAFFRLALEQKYEQAIIYASDMDDQGLGGRMILDLLKHRQELGIDVNTMTDNPPRQTPLHRVAINKKWHAYYALAERGANSYLKDSHGLTPQEYRSRNGMTVFNQQAQRQIIQDLFGDSAPGAEAFVNAVNGECTIS